MSFAHIAHTKNKKFSLKFKSAIISHKSNGIIKSFSFCLPTTVQRLLLLPSSASSKYEERIWKMKMWQIFARLQRTTIKFMIQDMMQNYVHLLLVFCKRQNSTFNNIPSSFIAFDFAWHDDTSLYPILQCNGFKLRFYFFIGKVKVGRSSAMQICIESIMLNAHTIK